MIETTPQDGLPVAVIGAGPIGLAAAAHLHQRGLRHLVLEAGSGPGASIGVWGHVRMFSPWKYMVDPVARMLLERTGWRMPDEEALPTGGAFIGDYLEPLAALPELAPNVHYEHRVVAVTRRDFDKLKSAGRDDAPFELHCARPDGSTVRVLARAVIDASGTYTTTNPLGSGGVPAAGERELNKHIHYGIPDVLRRNRGRYAGRRMLVIGSGHSAFNSLLDLAWLKTEVPETRILWAVRRFDVGRLFGGGESDALPARGSLGSKLRRLVELGVIELVTGFRARRLDSVGAGVLVTGEDHVLGVVDEIIVGTGFRPDLEMLRELRLGIDPLLESAVALAPLIDPNVHSCGTVPPHGHRELRHPERDFYIVGMKSYGRAPSFLLLTGYEQARSVVAALAGDLASADDVRLVLPTTGVCSGDLAGGVACCSSSASARAPAGGSCGLG